MDKRLERMLSTYEYNEKMKEEMKKALFLVENGLYDEEIIYSIVEVFKKIELENPKSFTKVIMGDKNYMARISDDKVCIVNNVSNSVSPSDAKYIVKTPITISNEDYERLSSYDVKSNTLVSSLNVCASILYVLAGLVFFSGILLVEYMRDFKLVFFLATLMATFQTVLWGFLVKALAVIVEKIGKIDDKLHSTRDR